MRRSLTERLIRGHHPTLTSILRVGGGGGSGGGVLPSGEFIIWVTKGGSDSAGDGTDEAPYLTIGKAMTVAAALSPTAAQPVLIFLGPGTYTENVSWVPWVFLTGFDQTTFAATINGNVALNSALWTAFSATDSPIAGFDSLEVSGTLTLNFTGCSANQGAFEIAGAFAGTTIAVTGDPTGGGFLQLFNCLDVAVGSTITITGGSFQSDGCNFLGDIHLVSTAAHAVFWDGSDYFGLGGSPPNVFLDASAGKNVTVTLSGSGTPGSLHLTDGGGGVTSYTATVGGIPGSIVKTGGAADPILVPYASTQLPSKTFEIYVDKSGNDTDGNGTTGAPFLTIGQAMTVAATLPLTALQPAIIFLGPGTFTENVSMVPFVIITGFDGSGFATEIDGTVGVNLPLWVAAEASFPFGGIDSTFISGDVTIDLHTLTSQAGFNLGPGVTALGNVTLIGSVFPSPFLLFGSQITGNFAVSNGAAVESRYSLFLSAISVTSSATQQARWQSFAGDGIGQEGTPFAITVDASAGTNVEVDIAGADVVSGITLTLKDGGGGHTSFTGTVGSIPSTVTRLGGAANPVPVPLWATAFAPIVPPALPATPILYSSGSITGTGNALGSTSDQGAITVLSIAGGSNRELVAPDAIELLAIAGGGGTKSASYGLPTETCTKVYVTVVGVGATGSDGFCEEAVATVRVTAGGVAAFPAAVGGSSNPVLNPNLDKVSDATFNSGGGVPSAIALTVAAGNLVVTVTNNGVGANDFVVYLYSKVFAV